MAEKDEEWKRRDRIIRGEPNKTDEKRDAKLAGSSPAYQGGGPAGENVGESGISKPAAEVLKDEEK